MLSTEAWFRPTGPYLGNGYWLSEDTGEGRGHPEDLTSTLQHRTVYVDHLLLVLDTWFLG